MASTKKQVNKSTNSDAYQESRAAALPESLATTVQPVEPTVITKQIKILTLDIEKLIDTLENRPENLFRNLDEHQFMVLFKRFGQFLLNTSPDVFWQIIYTRALIRYKVATEDGKSMGKEIDWILSELGLEVVHR